LPLLAQDAHMTHQALSGSPALGVLPTKSVVKANLQADWNAVNKLPAFTSSDLLRRGKLYLEQAANGQKRILSKREQLAFIVLVR